MTSATQIAIGVGDLAGQMCSQSPVGTWYDPNHELVILGRKPKDDDDELLDDLDFKYLATVRGDWQYPELPRINFPSHYLRITDSLPYPQHLVGRIGQSGWNYVAGVVEYAVIEFDLLADGIHEGTGICASEMAAVEAALAGIDCAAVNRSTGGGGLHVRVPLANPLKVSSRAEYGKVNRRALAMLDEMHSLPFKLADKVDDVALGRGVLWMWSYESNERSFQLVTEATETLDIGEWTPANASESTPAPKRAATHGFDLRDFLTRNDIPFTTKEYANADDGFGYLVTCPANHGNQSDSKTMLWVNNGWPVGKCMAEKCKNKTGLAFLKLLAPSDPVCQRTRSEWTVMGVLHDAEKHDEFFHDSAGNPYVQFRYDNGPPETFTVASQCYRDCLRRRYRSKNGLVLSEQNLSLAIAELEAYARLSCPELDVNVRVAECNGAHYLDLCDPNCQAVEITATGWRVVAAPAGVRFTRPSNLSALPVPEHGGNIQLLRKYVHVDESDWPLIPAWILGAMRSNAPCPGMALVGPGGSFKSNTLEMAISTFHPTASTPPKEFTLPGYPKTIDDLIVAAYNSWVVGVDNVTNLPQAMSDCLCCLITGSARTVRKLYSDTDISTVSVRRPIAITSTKRCITASDLADRFIVIDVSRRNELRRPELELWSEFQKDRPLILGALLDAFSTALAGLDEIVVDNSPRMIDFAKFASAAEASFGFAPGTTVAAMNARQRQIAEDSVSSNDLALAIETLAHAGGFEGTATALIEKLGPSDKWSQKARKFRDELNDVISDLEKLGVMVADSCPRSNLTIWTISTIPNNHVEPDVSVATEPLESIGQ